MSRRSIGLRGIGIVAVALWAISSGANVVQAEATDCDCDGFWWSDTCGWTSIGVFNGHKYKQIGGNRAEPKCHASGQSLPVSETIYLEIYTEVSPQFDFGFSFYVDFHGGITYTEGHNQGDSFENKCNTPGCCTPAAYCYARQEYVQEFARQFVMREVPSPTRMVKFHCAPCTTWSNQYVKLSSKSPICSNTVYVVPPGDGASAYVPALQTTAAVCAPYP